MVKKRTLLSRRNLIWGGRMIAGIIAAENITRNASGNAQSSTSTNPSYTKAMTDLNPDYVEIINTVNRISIHADLRNWAACRNCFADQVEVDYTSLQGGKPAMIAADTLLKQWATSFDQSFKTTQHLIGSHAVTLKGDTATCISQFQAHHVLLNSGDSPFWRLGGIYHHSLARSSNGWRVFKLQMTARWEEGKRPSA
jgi:SnoaL-like domain